MKTFGDYLLEERDALKRKLDAIELLLEDYEIDDDEEEEAAEPKKQTSKPPKNHPWRGNAIEKTLRKCKNCGKPGHRKDTCPDLNDDAGDEADKDEESVITRAQVQELKDEGMSSLQVAAKLKCKLVDVSKLW